MIGAGAVGGHLRAGFGCSSEVLVGPDACRFHKKYLAVFSNVE